MLLFDARWIGHHGIGRFAREIVARLPSHRRMSGGPKPLSPMDPLWSSWQAARVKPDVYLSPGFNPPALCRAPLVFTIHDLIHLKTPDESSPLKRAYFQHLVLPGVRRATRILTVSDYSRRDIAEWSGVPEHKIVVVGNGVSPAFSPVGPAMQLGGRYVLYVGNRKPHKNLDRLFEAMSNIDDRDVQLALSGVADHDTARRIAAAGLSGRVIFAGNLSDDQLAALYRGAEALILPSLIEGFGLPVLEAMASGTPVVAASTSSIPEIAGDAAELVDPQDTADICRGLNRILADQNRRQILRDRGLSRARHFTWECVAARVNQVVREAVA